jgi:hypothetical protein
MGVPQEVDKRTRNLAVLDAETTQTAGRRGTQQRRRFNSGIEKKQIK